MSTIFLSKLQDTLDRSVLFCLLFFNIYRFRSLVVNVSTLTQGKLAHNPKDILAGEGFRVDCFASPRIALLSLPSHLSCLPILSRPNMLVFGSLLK